MLRRACWRAKHPVEVRTHPRRPRFAPESQSAVQSAPSALLEGERGKRPEVEQWQPPTRQEVVTVWEAQESPGPLGV